MNALLRRTLLDAPHLTPLPTPAKPDTSTVTAGGTEHPALTTSGSNHRQSASDRRPPAIVPPDTFRFSLKDYIRYPILSFAF